MYPYLGQIKQFPYDFTPSNYLPCDGRLLPIEQYLDLFELIGTTYGGDGQTNFALPDLRLRTAVGVGSGPGLPPQNLGQKVGAEYVTLAASQMPAHDHQIGLEVSVQIPATTAPGTSMTPSINVVLATANDESVGAEMDIYSNGPGDTHLQPFSPSIDGVTTPTGDGRPVYIGSPYQVLNFCIAVQGLYPTP